MDRSIFKRIHEGDGREKRASAEALYLHLNGLLTNQGYRNDSFESNFLEQTLEEENCYLNDAVNAIKSVSGYEDHAHKLSKLVKDREKLTLVKDEITKKLEHYKLSERIFFDDSALNELLIISGGDSEGAILYAGTAVLNALQIQGNKITAEDIRHVNVFEAIGLISGGKSTWDDVRYIGTQVPNMYPQGVQLKRMLTNWDADRVRDTRESVETGKFPKYALPNKARYKTDSSLGPELIIPFKYSPSKDEIKAVAGNFAEFLQRNTGQPQLVDDLSFPGMGDNGVQFVIKEEHPSKDKFLARLNYRITSGFSGNLDERYIISISKDLFCKHEEKTLEDYFRYIGWN